MIPQETAYDESECWFQLEVLDRSLSFIDFSWRSLLGKKVSPSPTADNDQTRASTADGSTDADLDFYRAETPTVIREARDAVATLKSIHSKSP